MKEVFEALCKLTDEQTAVLIYDPISRKYLTGFSSSLGYLFLKKGKTVLFVDGRYFEAAKAAVDSSVLVVLIENLSQQIQALLGESVTKLLVETTNTVATVRGFESAFKITVEPDDRITVLLSNKRLIKTYYEIDCITKAQRIAEQAFDHILGFIRAGVTELEIAAELEYCMKRLGSTAPSFETIAVSGEKSSMPHGVPDGRVVKNGDFITMDFGARWGGYHSDMTRTVAVGFVTDEMKKVYETVLSANITAIQRVSEGVIAADVDLAARNLITDAGYGTAFSHSTGHGIGLDVHEAPNISSKNQAKLQSGMVITIEPGIYLAGKFGVRIEDMVVVTKNGSNNLTNAEKRLIIL